MSDYIDPPSTSPSPRQPYAWAGWLLVIGGFLCLLLSFQYVKTNFPFLDFIWPVLLVIALIMTAVRMPSHLVSIGLAVLSLCGVLVLLNGSNHFLREFVGVIIVLAGLVFTIRYFFIIPLRRGKNTV
jgi:hypothetical protein